MRIYLDNCCIQRPFDDQFQQRIKNESMIEVTYEAMKLLYKNLGVHNTLRFIRQFKNGEGDYTKERQELLKDMTLEELVKEIKKYRTEK